MNKDSIKLTLSDLISFIEKAESEKPSPYSLEANLEKLNNFKNLGTQSDEYFSLINNIIQDNKNDSHYFWTISYITVLLNILYSMLYLGFSSFGFSAFGFLFFNLVIILFHFLNFNPFSNLTKNKQIYSSYQTLAQMNPEKIINAIKISQNSESDKFLEKNISNGLIHKFLLKFNVGYRYKYNAKLLDFFTHSNPLKNYYGNDYNTINKKNILKFVTLMNYFQKQKNYFNTKPDNFKILSRIYPLSFIGFYFFFILKIFFDGIGIVYFIAPTLVLFFSIFYSLYVLKTKPIMNLEFLNNVSQLKDFLKLSNFQDSLVKIGLVDPDYFVKNNFEINDCIDLFKNIQPERQEHIVNNLAILANKNLTSYEKPHIF